MDADAIPTPSSDPTRPMALVVDDEPLLASLTAMALGSLGWRTVVVTEADHAVELARDLDIDLLVTDLHMPGMSGLDLAGRLRAVRADLPVMLVSGSVEAADLAFPQPFAFLAKPYSLSNLFGTVGALVAPDRMEA